MPRFTKRVAIRTASPIALVTPIPTTVQDVASIPWIPPFTRRSCQRVLPGLADTGAVPDSCQSPLAASGRLRCVLCRGSGSYCSGVLPTWAHAARREGQGSRTSTATVRDEAQVPDRVRDRPARDNGPRRVRTPQTPMPGAGFRAAGFLPVRAAAAVHRKTRIVGLNGSRAGRPFLEPPGRCRPGAIARRAPGRLRRFSSGLARNPTRRDARAKNQNISVDFITNI